MFPNTVFEIDENHLGVAVKKNYKDYPFPVEMLITGRVYSGIESSFNKPHGKKHVMEAIVKFLIKGPKQYKSFVSNMLKKNNWPDLNDSLEILLIDGIVQVLFKNQKPQKGSYWIPSAVQLDPRASVFFTQRESDRNLEAVELKEMVIQLLAHTSESARVDILRFVNEGVIIKSDMQVADITSFEKFKSIVLAISYYCSLNEQGRVLPLRHISNQIWGEPKILAKYKNEIAFSAGITLEELESVLLPDINNSLHAPLIAVSPAEDLQHQFFNLSSYLQLENSQESISIIVKNIDYCLQTISEYIEELPDNNNDMLPKFLSEFALLKQEILDGEFVKANAHIQRDLNQIISVIKSQLYKTDSIRRKFELIVLKEIGSGSFARVYKVFDPESSKIVACKVLFPRSYFKQVYGTDGDEYIHRFKREIRLLTKELQHMNIIKVEKIQHNSAPFWFTMPLADCSLEKWMSENRHAPEEVRLSIFKQIITGIKYLHEENKYHRDLAPNNILLFKVGAEIKVKIADFGLAKDSNSNSFFTGLSKRGYGQENFTDPEQLNSLSNSSHLSDIYSLGALLYYLLSGKLPKKRFYVSVACQNIVLKAMDKRVNRYQTVYELENDLNILLIRR
ncbi:serine/threonine protein kinase [Paenibacillus amylolyticus]|uniref:serine/threonine protein kinase n=1 Tax=Paenibacillus amylolyticus TaxID=1451 RepID=UPI00249A77C0|nr:serine/threonine-protein kinase [Paenibacillus amylolyticus]WFA88035.1 serine/threonine protein kinase [Paenibacillus amylolyticus]